MPSCAPLCIHTFSATQPTQHIDGINLFGLISIVSLFLCIPAAVWAEGHLWGPALQSAVSSLGAWPFYQLLGLSGLFYHLYNQVLVVHVSTDGSFCLCVREGINIAQRE